MQYTISGLMEDIRICLDENSTSATLVAAGDIDTLSVDEIIRSKIRDAVERVHMAAPHHRLESGHNFGDNGYWGDQLSGWIALPDDFMRLVVFEMSDWESPVFNAITPDDPLYAKQRQRIKALRGTAQRPVCAIVSRQEGKALEFYSCKSEDATVRRAQYIPYPKIETTDGIETIDISKRCKDAVVYEAAALTLTTLGDREAAAAMEALCSGSLT